jgi:hypothetical protein
VPRVVEPVCIGPTWRPDPDHPTGYAHPKLTLGWDAIYWVHKWLRLPNGSHWKPTDEQERFLLWWMSVDESGRFVYRDGVLQRLKGWGKDPLGAVLCAIEFVGPSRIDPSGRTVQDLYGNEHPAGVAHPQAWVQTAAVSKDQTKNTMTLFPVYFSKEAVAEYEIDLGKEIIYAHHGAQRIEAVTSSPNTLEGARATFVLMNETHHWLSTNEGHEMAAVISRNAAKSPDGAARSLAITNAYEPGEESVAQHAREAYEDIAAGRSVDVGFIYDSIEAPPEATLEPATLPETITAIRGDAYWLDIPRIVQEILDKRNPPSRSRRFWLNQIVATEDAWVTPQEWDVLADKTETVEEGEAIALGFDGSTTDDHCALIGCRISDGFSFVLGIWDPEQHGGEAPREQIDGAVEQAFEDYDVVAFFSDLHPWESYVDKWSRDHGRDLCAKAGMQHPIAFDMRGRGKEFTLQGSEFVHNEIEEKAFKHDGDPRLRQHVHNARRRPNAWGFTFGKEHRESRRKVDGLAALILARMARRSYLLLPPHKQRRVKHRRPMFA